jgi:hypothetical protein
MKKRLKPCQYINLKSRPPGYAGGMLLIPSLVKVVHRKTASRWQKYKHCISKCITTRKKNVK